MTTPDDSIIIDFDRNWKYCQQYSNDKPEITSDWKELDLPHVTQTSNQQWWYSKQFTRIPTEQEFYLMLENSHILSDLMGTIWLNNTKIFSGSLLELNQPVKLPERLLQNKITEENGCNNTLTICCLTGSLSLHVRLLLTGKVIVASGQVNVNDELSSNNTNKQNENEVLDYTVSMGNDDGRIDLAFNSKTTKYKAPIRSSLSDDNKTKITKENKIEPNEAILVPRLAIVILVVGTRGDVQPFIALGQALRAHGHRVRLATHETFRSFVCGNGLEFYPLGGDPADLISFMVKNAGIIPSMDSIIAGDVGKKRRSLSDILASTWQACIANDDETNLPFIAEAIIANPPSFGHIHCAERLQIPLHMIFTMPWSPTAAFPHPLSNIDNSTGSKKIVNRYSYEIIEMLTWTGLRDIVNDFRKSLGLLTLNTSQAVSALTDEQVPHTYCWSPSLVPKPDDWGEHINVSGFFFLDLGTAYTNPPQDLLAFLGLDNVNSTEQKLPPPIYIGFGSIAGHDSRRMLDVVVDALKQTGYRALLAGLASETDELPPNIFKIGNVPHDWLFQHVSAVCHHGGAGTTAAGLRAGKPTIIVPFFGDQFFWGTVVEKSGAGPRPLPGKSITSTKFVQALHFVHEPAARAAAERLRDSILTENGCEAAVYAFHKNLPLKRMHSDLELTFPACYQSKQYKIQISRPVAQVLVSSNLIEENQLRSHAIKEWEFMYDRHMHIVMHGFFEHFRKAFSTMFIDTASDLKRSASSNDVKTRGLYCAGSVAKGIGLGLGHITIGYLSVYGEITDVLDHAVYTFDPYSDPKARPRPCIKGFKSGAIAAGLSFWNGWKDGFVGLVKEPYNGYKRHGVLGGAAGSLMGTVNVGLKPVIGTMSSLTWLGRGSYVSLRNVIENYKKEGRYISSNLIEVTSTNNDAQTQNENMKHISSAAKNASKISGYHPEVCQHIIDEFQRIKSEHEQEKKSSTNRRNPISFFSKTNKNNRSRSLNRQPKSS